jgi:hypothetical protein
VTIAGVTGRSTAGCNRLGIGRGDAAAQPALDQDKRLSRSRPALVAGEIAEALERVFRDGDRDCAHDLSSVKPEVRN